jgi:hypothetical protein
MPALSGLVDELAKMANSVGWSSSVSRDSNAASVGYVGLDGKVERKNGICDSIFGIFRKPTNDGKESLELHICLNLELLGSNRAAAKAKELEVLLADCGKDLDNNNAAAAKKCVQDFIAKSDMNGCEIGSRVVLKKEEHKCQICQVHESEKQDCERELASFSSLFPWPPFWQNFGFEMGPLAFEVRAIGQDMMKLEQRMSKEFMTL